MNDVQKILAQLRKKGWTLAAIGKELDIPGNTIRKWSSGLRYPANPSTVRASLYTLSQRNPKHAARSKRLESRSETGLSPEVLAGLGIFQDLAPQRSAVDELIQERRKEAVRE